jgi:PKD repeat protein
MKKRLLSMMTLGLSIVSFGQVSEGGLPTTFAKVIQGDVSEFNTNYQVVNLSSPNMQTVYSQDELTQDKHEGYRVSILQPVSLSIQNSGTWQVLDNGDKIWRLGVKMENATALSLYFSDAVIIPEGGMLHAYNENHSQYVGAFTSNTQTFQSMEMIEGELLTLEYYMPAGSTQLPILNISDVAYYYRGVDDRVAAFRDGFSIESQTKTHQSCEVDVACSEINGWAGQRDAVVQYNFVVGGSGYLCSGSMVNNTANDCKAYFLTANHCGEPTANADITQHTFYFNYQRPTCVPGTTASYSGAQSQTVSGGTLKASSELGNQTAGTNQVSGSDFVLIEMNTVPAAYNAYYAGWDRATSGSTSGVGIHHPAGDEKKVSTYTSNLSSATYNGGWSNAHWEVQWIATTNGHGVTEGGSSGSPIFNTSGLIVGHLSGGSSYCTSPNATDLYGKFIKAWDQEGTSANQQLKTWLDPSNSGVMTLSGTYAPCTPSAPVANFIASSVSVIPGSTVTLTDLSSNTPTSWAWTISPGTGWTYAGGTNATSQNPQVTFNTLGLHTVTLTATNAVGSDSETKTNYINVTAAATPCVATSTHACTTDDVYISNVTLNTLNNNSSCSNYTDFTAQSTTLTQGLVYDVSVMPTVQGSVGSAYTGDEIAVWIDWNGNADFDDAGEDVGYVLVDNGWSNIFSFTVPANTVVGDVTMRVRMSYEPIDGAISPCGTTEYGETEDYTITIQGGVTVSAPVAQFTANQTTAVENTTISFTDQSTNTPTSWAWTVSPGTGWTYTGGTNATSQNPQINFTNAGTYSVTLMATNSAGNDSEVKTNYITITEFNGVEENELSNISIYPNPTNSIVYVDLNDVKALSVVITDVTGRVVSKDFNPTGLIELELSNQSTGVYFIRINSENNSITKKVVKK